MSNDKQEVRFSFDSDALLMDDLEVLDGSKAGTRFNNMLDVLDRVVVGGVRGKGYPAATLVAMSKAIFSSFGTEEKND